MRLHLVRLVADKILSFWNWMRPMTGTCKKKTVLLLLVLLSLAYTGCQTMQQAPPPDMVAPPLPSGLEPLPAVYDELPRELSKIVLPTYVIEPPDILTIQTVNAVPRSPYHLRTLDVLSIQVAGALPEYPIAGTFSVEPGGVVSLGVPYGTVRVAGLSVQDAQAEITKHLRQFIRDPQVAIALLQLGGPQHLTGDFLVGPDGTVSLGSYGSVHVVGHTLDEAKAIIEQHLSKYLEDPTISIGVSAYNSKVYYVVLQGAGFGDAVYRFPITGNDTVLDAIAAINGLEQVSSKRIWVSRPSHVPGQPQVLPVDWYAITEQALPGSNYQLLPGDRVFVAEDPFVAFDTRLGKLLTPMERIMGFSLLGVGTVTRFSGPVLRGGGNPRSTF